MRVWKQSRKYFYRFTKRIFNLFGFKKAHTAKHQARFSCFKKVKLVYSKDFSNVLPAPPAHCPLRILLLGATHPEYQAVRNKEGLQACYYGLGLQPPRGRRHFVSVLPPFPLNWCIGLKCVVLETLPNFFLLASFAEKKTFTGRWEGKCRHWLGATFRWGG